MKWSHLVFANYFIFLTVALLLAALQVSLWEQVMGFFPAPHFWMTVLVFWCLYRSVGESIAMVYLISIILAAFTVLSVGLIILINLGVAVAVSAIKRRVYLPGSNYFMVMCGLGTLLFTGLHLLLSWTVEERPVVDIEAFNWIVRSLLTALLAWPFFSVYQFIDRMTDKTLPAESGQFE